MNVGIGAIFRDECEYILEWLAWHHLAGFRDFYVADNGSTDGTLALLEALELEGYIYLLYQPVLPQNAQIKAYERILQVAVGNADAIYFIDADEFICHDSFEDGEEFRATQALLTPPQVGALALTWRLFGSSGKADFENKPVVERFTRYASYGSSRLVKSAVKIPFVQSVSVHYARLHDNVAYVDASGSIIDDFITYKDNNKIKAVVSGMRDSACSTGLMINHYVIKSKQEFLEKKVKRGDAMLGTDFKRSMDFFNEHDRNEHDFQIPDEKIIRLKSLMATMQQDLDDATPLSRQLRGHVDMLNESKLIGWLVDSEGHSNDLVVNVFVNGEYVGSTSVGYFRADLKEKGISVEGMSGFTWNHAKLLNTGDVVQVRVNANEFTFANGQKVIM